jgi:hypothetical protein
MRIHQNRYAALLTILHRFSKSDGRIDIIREVLTWDPSTIIQFLAGATAVGVVSFRRCRQALLGGPVQFDPASTKGAIVSNLFWVHMVLISD